MARRNSGFDGEEALMIEVYFWEDDDIAEDLLQELKRQGRDFKSILLDPETGGGEPCVITPEKTYWDIGEALEALKA